MEVVLHIAEKRGDWVYYDVAFQGNVAKNEACWCQTHLEVFVFVMLLAHGQCTGRTPQARGQPKLYIPLGACISFHHAVYCSAGSRCIYQQYCSNASCLSNHSTSQCHKPLLNTWFSLDFNRAKNDSSPFALHPQPTMPPHQGTHLSILATASKKPPTATATHHRKGKEVLLAWSSTPLSWLCRYGATG